MKKKKKSSLIVICFFLIIGLIIYGTYSYLLSFSGKSKAGEGNIKVKPVENKEATNILIMGVDIGDPKSNSKEDPKRTDTIMVLNYNPLNKQVNVISIPRDTLIKIRGRNTKINSAHVIGGVNYLIDAVEELLDIDINYYAKLDYEGFRNIIDSIGGVDIKIKNNMYYDDVDQNLSIHFNKGEVVHLDGADAERFFRWRKNNDRTGLLEGDLGRIKNQHEFINQVINKIKSPAIIPKIPNILSTVPKYVETNMDPEDIIKYGYIIIKSDKEKINIHTLRGDTKYINRVSYFIYDKNKNQDILDKLYGIDNGELNKRDLKVKILNGTNINGLAKRFFQKLTKKGYRNIIIGNGQKTRKSKIIVHNLTEDQISIIKDEFFITNIEKSEKINEEFDIIVLIGDDFDSSDI